MSIIWSNRCGNSFNSVRGNIYCIVEYLSSSTLMFQRYITNVRIRKIFKLRYIMNRVPILLLRRWYIERYCWWIPVSFVGYCNPFSRRHLLQIWTTWVKTTVFFLHWTPLSVRMQNSILFWPDIVFSRIRLSCQFCWRRLFHRPLVHTLCLQWLLDYLSQFLNRFVYQHHSKPIE